MTSIVVRVGEDVRLEGFELRGDGALVTTSLGAIEVNFTMRHLAENAVYALAAYRALGLPLERAGEGASAIAFAEWRNQELPLPGGGLLINDAWNANPVSMRAALEHLRERARRPPARSPSSARWPSSATTRKRVTARSRAPSRRSGSTSSSPSGRRPRRTAAAGSRAPTRRPRLLRDLFEPGDCVLVKGARALALEGIADDLANLPA